jgi:hypothetical protein
MSVIDVSNMLKGKSSLDEKLEKSMMEGIDKDNCGSVVLDENEEYYDLTIELSTGEKVTTQIWKDEMTAGELFSQFITFGENLTKFM